MEEKPYNHCIKNGNIDLKSKLFNIRIPLDTYKQVVEMMDDFITKQKQKSTKYAENFEQRLDNLYPSVGMAGYYNRGFLFGPLKKYFNHENQDTE